MASKVFLFVIGALAAAPSAVLAQTSTQGGWSYDAPAADPLRDAPWRTPAASAAPSAPASETPWRATTSEPANPLSDTPWRTAPQTPPTAPFTAAPTLATSAPDGVQPLAVAVQRDRPLTFSKNNGAYAPVVQPTAAGAIGAVAGLMIVAMIQRSQGRQMVGQYGLVDPSDAMAAELADYLAADRGGFVARAPIRLGPKDGSPLTANVEKARFVIDVSSSGSFGGPGGAYRSTARIYDATTRKVVSTQNCVAQREQPPKPGRGQPKPSEEALVKTALRVGADYCLAQFKDGLATLDTGPHARLRQAQNE